MKADFSGYATKAGVRCSDGLVIMTEAFKHQDKARVPLVWQHGHSDPDNVLGHAILEHRTDGVYAYAYFNDTPKAKQAQALVKHGDITQMSIWANQLIKRAQQVLHGAIREVSLVLAGANPGARIDPVSIRHSDGEPDTVLEDEALIFTGLELEHADDDAGDDGGENGKTLQDVYDTLNDEQKDVVHFMIGQALESAGGEKADDTAEHGATNSDKEGKNMTHKNAFEKDGKEKEGASTLSHDAMKEIVADAIDRKVGLKQAVSDYALSHGIEDIETLFPDARPVDGATPEWVKRRTEWVASFMGAVRKSPFARIKTSTADLTHDEARAKGYIKATLKKEQFFKVLSRTTTPTTVYKKQKLDRDDIIDITDYDVVSWIKSEMRFMLEEEIARAIIFSDGRAADDPDKINEDHIRPIVSDDELYVTTINVNILDGSSSMQEVTDAIITNRAKYKGTGTPTLYTTEFYIAKWLLLKDTTGRRIYRTLDELATELRVSAIVPVEVMESYPELVAVIVNPIDYVVGADKGGQTTMFDDFDIDYNQYKYLIETRLSGALVKVKSALVVRSVAAGVTLVTPTAPDFDATTGELTINNTTGVVYKHGATTVNNAGSPYTVDPGDTWVIDATPSSSSYAIAVSDQDQWTFTADA